jgi:hypothetical protein
MENHHLSSTGKPAKNASGIRLAFDKLSGEVEKAITELSFLQKHLPNALSDYRQAVLPLYETLRSVRKHFLMDLENLLLGGSLSRYQKNNLTDYLLHQIRKTGAADEDLKSMFNRYSDEPLSESHPSDNIEQLQDFPESESLETEELNEKKPWEKARDEHQKNRRYRKKDEQAQQLKRSVKTVYTGLMKVFHPDLETDPERKAEKEEISKQITVAYGNQDFIGLLKLESEFLTSQKQRLGQLNDPQLRQYIEVLKEQKTELRKQFDQLKTDYGFLFDAVATGSEKPMQQLIKSEKAAIESAVLGYRARIRILQEADGAELKMLLSVLEEELEMMSDTHYSAIYWMKSNKWRL